MTRARRDFILRGDQARSAMAAAWHFATMVLQAGNAARVRVEELKPNRTTEQNAKLWAVLGDISRDVEWFVDGRQRHLTPEEWKHVLTAGLKKHQRIAHGIDGGFVILGQSTSQMTIGEMGELIELAEAFGTEHGVRWSA